MFGLRSLVSASLRASVVRPKKQSVPLFSYFNKAAFNRSYCSAPKQQITPPPVQGVVKDVPHRAIDADADLQLDLAPRLPISMEPRKYIEFDCAVCNYRVKKTCTTHSYEKGVVLMRCDGCKKLHLIADHLGWTGYEQNEKTIEEFARSMGKSVKTTPE